MGVMDKSLSRLLLIEVGDVSSVSGRVISKARAGASLQESVLVRKGPCVGGNAFGRRAGR